MSFTVLIVDDEPKICLTLRDILKRHGYQARFCTDPLQVIPALRSAPVDLLLIDVKMPGQDGIDLLRSVRAENPDIPVIMISGHATVDSVVIAMKYGALNFYTKPIDNGKLISEIDRLAGTKDFQKPAVAGTRIVTQDPAMLKVIELAKKAAPTNAAVIITGESGTGKELVADLIHRHSTRDERPFIKVNCAAIPEDLLESEMFGHERGAFTDAKAQKQGVFERAGDGTIFLDEIGDMSQKTQAKMLRVLQDGSFTRVGGSVTLRAGCRIVTATNKSLPHLIDKGLFREDLYYRLSVVTLHLPPLRERRGDIPLLADYFLKEFDARYEKPIRTFSEQVRSLFLCHDWPGNVRELRNLVERAVIFCEEDAIDASLIPEHYQGMREAAHADSLDERYKTSAREVIVEALRECGGVKQKAAVLLKIDRKTLYRKMRRYNITP
jgi:DNA-binding NtrC family response regulator